jgi:hypothetical protein
MTYNLIIDPVAGDIVPVPLQPVVQTVNQQLTKFVCKEHFLWLHWQQDLTKPLENAIDTKIASQSTVIAIFVVLCVVFASGFFFGIFIVYRPMQ